MGAYETVYAGPVEIRYMTKHYTHEEMLEAARFFQSAFPGLLPKFAANQGDDTYRAVLKDDGRDKGILSFRGDANNFVGNSFNSVLGQMGQFLKQELGSI